MTAPTADDLRLVVQAARAHGLPPLLVAAIVQQESNWDARAYRAEPQIDDASLGWMQTLGGTAAQVGYDGPLDGLYKPGVSLAVGCRYLAWLTGRYGGDQRQALAAYNAGPGNVARSGWTVAGDYVRAVWAHMDALVGAVVEADNAWFAPGDQVPYVSQLEPSGLGMNNCGPAALTMLLAFLGAVDATPAAMHAEAEAIRGAAWDVDTYVSFGQLIGDCNRRGLTPEWLQAWDAVFAALDRGQPVLLLVDNSVLDPPQYPHTAAFNAHHFVVVTAYDALDFRVNDPLAVGTRGPCTYTGRSVRRAVDLVGGVQGFCLPLPASPPAPPQEEPMPDPAPEPITLEERAVLDLLGLRAIHTAEELQGLYDWTDETVKQRDDLEAEVKGLHEQVDYLKAQLDAAQKAPPAAAVSVQLVAAVTYADGKTTGYFPVVMPSPTAATGSGGGA